MFFNIKEYTFKFDTPLARLQERVIVSKIFDLLNNNKYDSLDDLLKYGNSYDEFLKKNNLTTVIKHFGNSLNEANFIEICNNIRSYISKKSQFSEANIKVSQFGSLSNKEEYVSYEGAGVEKPIHIDNTPSGNSIQEQMKHMQETGNASFITTDAEKNTQNMMKSLADNSKITVDFKPLYEVVLSSLSDQEMQNFNIAFAYQEKQNRPISVDLARGLINDPANKEKPVMKISEVAEKIEEAETKEAIKEESKEKTYQKTYKVPATIYTDMKGA